MPKSEKLKLINGASEKQLKLILDFSVDAIVTDPPAGISFMGKDWDKDKGGRDQWIAWMESIMRECLRILKPGGHLLCWAIPRTSHWTATAIENAGFEVRDIVMHIFGTGFPKPEGLKPAHEDWILARKPITEKNINKNVEKYGTGRVNFDQCRISDGQKKAYSEGKIKVPTGRFPANLVLSHHPDCECVGVKKVKGTGHFPKEIKTASKKFGQCKAGIYGPEKHMGTETVENWNCVDGCPVKELDRQSGKTVSVKTSRGELTDYRGNNYGRAKGKRIKGSDSVRGYVDEGGASRFFYVAKPSRRERGENNNHPTVKPVKLMRYLCKMITPAGGTVLDPFMGSGSTGIGAIREGFNFIGIEKEKEYFEISKARIKGDMPLYNLK